MGEKYRMKKLILFGAGDFGKKWLSKLGFDRVYAFADFDPEKVGTKVDGKEVLSIESVCKLDKEKAIFVSTSQKYGNEIIDSLIQYGLQEYIVMTPYFELGHNIQLDTFIDVCSILEGKNSILGGASIIKSYIGYASYVAGKTTINQTRVGRYCSIGPNVEIIRGQHPTKEFVSTYPGFYSPNNPSAAVSFNAQALFEEYRYADYPYAVTIGNDVWIGSDTRVMEGVKIADGTIVAAGAMVVKDTEAYTIVGGVPAKVIGERFRKPEREFLLELKWWDKPEEWIRRYAEHFKSVNDLKNAVGK